MFNGLFHKNWSTLKKLIWLKATALASAIRTFTGTLVSFVAKKAVPMLSLVCSISPVQSLNGYDAPWPAGGGKNKLSVSSASVSDSLYKAINVDTIPAGTYTLSGVLNAGSSTARVSFRTSPQTAVQLPYVDGGRGSVAVTLAEDCSQIYFYYSNGSSGTGSREFSDLMLEAGETATAYAPYSNICPIYGHSGVTTNHVGKNMYSGETVTLTNQKYTSVSVETIPAGTYVISAVLGTNPAGGKSRISFRDSNSAQIVATEIPYSASGRSASASFTLTKDCPTIYFYSGSSASDTGSQTYTDIQIEIGSTATDFTPYVGSTIPVTFPTPPGTVYGGTVDLVSGVLTVDKAIVDLGDYTWSYNSTNEFFYTTGITDGVRNSNLVCSNYAATSPASASGWGNKPNNTIGWRSDQDRLCIKDSRYTDGPTFTTAMSGVKFVYELATPLVYQLTPQEISTLVGQNNVWQESGDNVSVTFKG